MLSGFLSTARPAKVPNRTAHQSHRAKMSRTVCLRSLNSRRRQNAAVSEQFRIKTVTSDSHLTNMMIELKISQRPRKIKIIFKFTIPELGKSAVDVIETCGCFVPQIIEFTIRIKLSSKLRLEVSPVDYLDKCDVYGPFYVAPLNIVGINCNISSIFCMRATWTR